MELANQIFYSTIAFISLGLVFPAYINLDTSKRINSDTHYWFLAAITQFVSGLGFASFPLIGKPGVVIGITAQYAVDVFLLLLFISLRKAPKSALVIPLLLSIAIVPFITRLDYVPRVWTFMGSCVILSLFQLRALRAIERKDGSLYC